MFFFKKSLNCNKNELCTKIQHDPNIFGENNGFFLKNLNLNLLKRARFTKKCEKVRY